VLLGFTASNCIIFSKYIFFALGTVPSESQHKALAVGLLTAITIIHGCFLKTGIYIQNILGWVKIFLIGAMSLTGIWVLFLQFYENTDDFSPGAKSGSSFSWNSMWEGSNWSWSVLSTALFKVYYSYAGLNNVNNVLNEVHDPVGIVKTVCPTALLTAGALYTLANLSYFLVIPLEEIKNSGELVGALLFQRLFGDHIGKVFFPLAIAISAAGNVMVVTFALVCLFPPGHKFQTNIYTLGAHQPGNSTTRVPSMAERSLVNAAIWHSTRWTDCALYPLCSGHISPATRRRLQLHPRFGGIPRTDLCIVSYGRSTYSSLSGARSCAAL
jgi:hypothetical protein